MVKFSILITTRNRAADLGQTLSTLVELLERPDVECIVCNDGSIDSTAKVLEGYRQVRVLNHPQSRGYLHARNRLLQMAKGIYAISLDDDAQFLSQDPLGEIEAHFERYPKSGVAAFRIFWSDRLPVSTQSNESSRQVKSFVGCGHAWRMEAWRDIPGYPEWFEFYGEEAVASMDLFKKGWEVRFEPSILIWHRVNLLQRSNGVGDWALRQRRSLRGGWYKYGLFLPSGIFYRYFSHSLMSQLQKIFKGEYRLVKPVLLALLDFTSKVPTILSQRRALDNNDFARYSRLPEAEIYWKPDPGEMV